MKKRIIRIGIDGAPFSALEKMSDQGVMPFFKNLRNQGIFRRLQASIPDNSAVSWSSVMTGVNPGTHGIFGFTDLISGTYTMRFPNFRQLQAQAFWQKEPDKRHVIINLPFTYPADQINGKMVSGFVAPSLEKAVYPESFLEYLKEKGYAIDADTRKIYQSKGLFYEDLMRVHQIRSDVIQEQFTEGGWDTFTAVFTGSDRIGHYMQDSYQNPDDPFHAAFLDYFTAVDRQIEWIFNHLNADDRVVMNSDHGMERVRQEVNLNAVLQNAGFQEACPDGRANYTGITEKTRAFVLEPSRIHLNLKGKYPSGSLCHEDRKGILNELEDLFLNLLCGSEKVIDKVYTAEELYSGPCTKDAPDMVLVSNTGYSLRGTLNRTETFTDPDILTGMHRGDDAFLYVHGLNNESHVPKHPKVEDILAIIENMKAI